MDILILTIGWILTVFLGALELLIVYLIVTGRIDLRKLISEPDSGDASLSRFQFLLFTFVIAMSLFFVIVRQDPPTFPDIPAGVFALLGISSASYVVSKAIQSTRDARMQEIEIAAGQPQPPAPPNP